MIIKIDSKVNKDIIESNHIMSTTGEAWTLYLLGQKNKQDLLKQVLCEKMSFMIKNTNTEIDNMFIRMNKTLLASSGVVNNPKSNIIDVYCTNNEGNADCWWDINSIEEILSEEKINNIIKITIPKQTEELINHLVHIYPLDVSKYKISNKFVKLLHKNEKFLTSCIWSQIPDMMYVVDIQEELASEPYYYQHYLPLFSDSTGEKHIGIKCYEIENDIVDFVFYDLSDSVFGIRYLDFDTIKKIIKKANNKKDVNEYFWNKIYF